MNISTFVFPENSFINTNWFVWTFLIIGWLVWVGATIFLHKVVKDAYEEHSVIKNNPNLSFTDKYKKYLMFAVYSLILSVGITMIVLGAYSTEFGTTYAEFINAENPDYNTIYYTVAWQVGFLVPGVLMLFGSSIATLKVVSAWNERHEYKRRGAPYSFWSFKGFWLQTRHIIWAILTLVFILMGWGFVVNGTGHVFGGIFVRSPV